MLEFRVQYLFAEKKSVITYVHSNYCEKLVNVHIQIKSGKNITCDNQIQKTGK